MDKYIIALLNCKGIGTTKLYNYIKKNNFDVEKIKNNIINFIEDEDYRNFETYLSLAEKEINDNYKKGISLITLFDEDFPTKLYVSSEPVLYLYYKGNINLLNEKTVTIIGTRKPDDYSIQMAKKVTKEISDKSYVIASGLALGIDTVAHQSCLEAGGKTIAVLPSSIDNIQPKSNTKLAQLIVEKKGCLITEYPSGSVVNKYNFARRDRIQSLLANCVIIPQANENSGTMIAVRKSIKDNKKVFQFSTNNNKFIKDTIDVQNNDYLNTIVKIVDESFSQEKRKEELVEKIFEQPTLFGSLSNSVGETKN